MGTFRQCLERDEQRLRPLGHRRVDRRPLDQLVGRQELPCQHVERVDQRPMGHECAVDDLDWVCG